MVIGVGVIWGSRMTAGQVYLLLVTVRGYRGFRVLSFFTLFAGIRGGAGAWCWSVKLC